MQIRVYIFIFVLNCAFASVHNYKSKTDYQLNRDHVKEICHPMQNDREVIVCYSIPVSYPINKTHYVYIKKGEYMVDDKLFATVVNYNAYILSKKDEAKITTFLKGLYAA